jgi:hypothetical protein
MKEKFEACLSISYRPRGWADFYSSGPLKRFEFVAIGICFPRVEWNRISRDECRWDGKRREHAHHQLDEPVGIRALALCVAQSGAGDARRKNVVLLHLVE